MFSYNIADYLQFTILGISSLVAAPMIDQTLNWLSTAMKDWKEYSWDDVVPDPIPHNQSHVAQIAYSPSFSEAMAMFRAVHAKHEVSERVLALTTAIIEMNPAHYSVWDYRFEIVSEIGNQVFDYRKVGLTPSFAFPPTVGEDGNWLNQFTLANAKNYQVWNYRQHLVENQNILWYKGEKLVIEMVLEDDSKNFHAWSHYKWLVQQSIAHCPQAFTYSELEAQTEKLLHDDVLNNSVWSFRYFVMSSFKENRDDDAEIRFVASKIAVRPGNESAWSYLRGYACDLGGPATVDAAKRVALEYEGEPRAVELLAELSSSEEAASLWKKLGDLEPVRKQFWYSRVV